MKLKAVAVSVMLAGGVMFLSACNDGQSDKTKAAAEAAAPAVKVTAESSFEDRSAYALGASVGMYVDVVQKEQGTILGGFNKDLIIKGFADSVNGKGDLTEEEIRSVLGELEQKMMAAAQEKAAAEAQANLKAGEDFLAANKSKEGVKVTDSGLQYKVIKEGSGKSPAPTDSVKVKYKGTLIDGTVFDEQTEAVTFPLGNIIPGWVEGMQLMKEGAVYEFYIPAELAYGEAGAGDIIAPNSVLVFNVELVGVESAESDAAEAETAAPVKDSAAK